MEIKSKVPQLCFRNCSASYWPSTRKRWLVEKSRTLDRWSNEFDRLLMSERCPLFQCGNLLEFQSALVSLMEHIFQIEFRNFLRIKIFTVQSQRHGDVLRFGQFAVDRTASQPHSGVVALDSFNPQTSCDVFVGYQTGNRLNLQQSINVPRQLSHRLAGWHSAQHFHVVTFAENAVKIGQWLTGITQNLRFWWIFYWILLIKQKIIHFMKSCRSCSLKFA